MLELVFLPGGRDIDDFVEAIANHPLFAIGCKEPLKTTSHNQGGRMIHHDHLSPYDYGFRTRRNFSVLAGYTKHW